MRLHSEEETRHEETSDEDTVPVVLKLLCEGDTGSEEDTPILRNNNSFDTIYEW